MSGKALLDTNAVIGLWNRSPGAEVILTHGDLCLPFAVVGELAFGAALSQRPQENSRRIQDLLLRMPVVYADLDTLFAYGEIRAALKKKGRPISENDIWISALGIQHRLPVVTRDGDFREVAGLKVESW